MAFQAIYESRLERLGHLKLAQVTNRVSESGNNCVISDVNISNVVITDVVIFEVVHCIRL